MGKAEFFTNITRALGRPTPDRIPGLPPWDLPPRAVDRLDGDQTVHAFAEAFTAVGGRFLRVPGWPEALEGIRKTMEDLGVTPPETAVWDIPQLRKLHESLPGLTLSPGIAQAARCKLGITGAHAAIAETGTLALLGGPGRERSVSLLPETHLVLFSPKELVKTLGDAFARLGEKEYRTLHFITGPSRTSDIEMDLTVGVHGPGKLIAILVDKKER